MAAVLVVTATTLATFTASAGPALAASPGTLTVTKQVAYRAELNDQFTVSVATSGGTTVGSASTSGTQTSASTTAIPVDVGSTYTITDAMVQGAAPSTNTLAKYTPTIVCTDTTTGNAVVAGGASPSWTLPIANPDAYQCTVTNTPVTATPPTVTCTSNANIFNTGSDGQHGVLPDNSNDANWEVSGPTASQGATVSPPSSTATWSLANVGKLVSQWDNSPFSNSQWISQQTIAHSISSTGDWYYRFRFNLAAAVNPASFALSMKFLADNTVAEVYVNGVAQSGYSTTDGVPQTALSGNPYFFAGFQLPNAATTTLNHDWQPGFNTIVVQIKSAARQEGFDAQLAAQALCPGTLTVSKQVAGRVQSADQFAVGVKDSTGAVLTTASTTGTNSSATTPATFVNAGSVYTITDAMVAGSPDALNAYVPTIACTDITTGVTASLGAAAPNWTLSPVGVDAYSCTITNTPGQRSFTVTKTASPSGVVHLGDEVTYTVVVQNTSPVPYIAGSQASFTDDLTDVLDDAVYNGDVTGGATVAGSALSWTGSLAPQGSPGDSATITYSVTVDQPDSGNDVLRNVVVGGTNCPTGSIDPACTTANAVEIGGLTLVKSADPSAAADYTAGQLITYHYLVTNTGNVTVTSVGINEGTFTGSGSLSAISCPVTTLAPGGQVDCTATYTLTQPDVDAASISNTATATGVTPTSVTVTSAPSTVMTPATPNARLMLSKSVSPTVVSAVGDPVSYSFLVTNTGNVTVSDVAIEESAFSGSGSLSAISCPAASLLPGEQETCTASYTATQADLDAGSIINTAAATGTDPSGAAVTSSESTATVAVAAAGALSLVKLADVATVAAVGDPVGYSFLVTNTGNVTVHGVGVDEVAFSGSGPLSAVSCPSDTLAPDAHETCTASYAATQADLDAGSVSNTATTTATDPSGALITSPQSTATVAATQSSALTLIKSVSPTVVSRAGQTVTYTFGVSNIGNVTVHGVAVDETTFNGSGTVSAISCASGTLAAGAQETCTASYTVTQADLDVGSIANTARATATAPGGATVTSNDSSVSVTAEQTGGMTLVKSADPSAAVAYTAGQQITYHYLVSNSGNVTVRAVAIAEGTFTGSGSLSAIACPVTTLAPAAQTDCTATYTLTQADVDAAVLTNTATASGTLPGGGPISSTPSTVSTPQLPRPSLTLVKSADVATVAGTGDPISYSFLVTNTGNVTVHGVGIDESVFSGTGALSAISCPAASLVPGQQETCTARYAVTQPDLDAGSVTNTATATGTDPSGTDVRSASASATVSVTASPALTLTKSASRTTVSAAGQHITYSFLITNNGNQTVRGVTVEEKSFSGSRALSAISCPSKKLAPVTHETCTATYTVTRADMGSKAITNTAVASATSGTGDGAPTVTSDPSTARVTVKQSSAPSSPTPSPSNSQGAAGTGGSTAATGTDLLALVSLASALLIAGALLLVATRRRRHG